MPAENSLVNQVLRLASEGTSVSFRELYSALSRDEIDGIKNGDINLEDIKDIVDEIADSKSNEERYKMPISKSPSQDFL